MFGLFKKQERIDQRWVFGALAAYIVMLVVNALGGGTTILGGRDTAAVSDAYPNLFAPAGHTFMIWGLIYLLLGILFFRLFELWVPKKSAVSNKVLNRVTVLFTVSSLLNAAWMFAWQFDVLWLSVILMIVLLAVLIRINRLLFTDKPYSLQEYAMLRLPFSVYFGWITVATIANITTWLVSLRWDGLGLSSGTWMVAVLIIGAVIGLVTAFRQKDPAYLAVFVWAYAGILTKHLSEHGWNGAYPSTIITLAILLAVFGATLIQMVRYLPTRLEK